MLSWAITFFVIALVAALLGFRGVAGMSANIGYLFAVIAVIFLVVALLSGRGPSVGPLESDGLLGLVSRLPARRAPG
jgi:uncharacterized membrane protein YtjA (UPF0391 family)